MDVSKCGVCSEMLTDGAHCASCDLVMHFHCGGVNESGYRRLGDRKQSWRCVKCKQAGNTIPVSPISSMSGPDAVLQEIRSLSLRFAAFETVKEEIIALRNEFTDLKISLTSQYNDVIKEVTGKIKAMEQRIIQVEKVQAQVEQLQIRIDKLEDESNSKEQWSRMNNVEIKGLPQTSNENLFDILTRIGNKINYPILKTQINFINRVPTNEKDRIKPVIVCFTQRYVKEDFIAAARREQKTLQLTPAKIGLSGNHKLFINDHLTMRNKMLLSKTKKIAKEKDFRYIWVKNAKIYVRKDDTSPIVMVMTDKDVSKII